MIYRIERSQHIEAPVERVWNFFADPKNLGRITPPDLNFEILCGGDEPLEPGLLIEYRISFLPLIRTAWLTEITQVDPLKYFIDEQRLGPYQFWQHQHRFQPVGNSTLMIDLVTYQLPFGLLGDLAKGLWIGPRLKKIFDYRAGVIPRLLA